MMKTLSRNIIMIGAFGLLGAAISALMLTSGHAQGAPASALRPAASGVTATLKGVVSVTELAASEANRQALQSRWNARPVEQPRHRLRDGSLTSAPSRTMLNALPVVPKPNVAVSSPISGAPLATFSSIKGFTGIHEGDNDTANSGEEFDPPDQGLAVNNNIAAEINNNVVRFFNATTGSAMTGPIATSAFFGASGFSLTDTQVFYDPVSQHWFFDEVISSSSFEGFAVAVSKTSNPLGSYFVYHIEAVSSTVLGCGGVDCFPDYPKAGYDANAFYITADLFQNTPTGSFVESAIYVLPKATLEAGTHSFAYYRFDDPSDFVVQPSVPAPGEPFSSVNNGSEFLMSAPFSPTLSVLAIYNTNNIVSSPGSLKMLRTTVVSESFGGSGTVPMTQPNVVGTYCASVGATSAPSLDGGYSDIQATVQKASGNLYAALPYAATDGTGFNRDVIAWFEVLPTLTTTALSASIVHQGYVVPPNGYSVSYPAFGLNQLGAGVMGMTITNKSASVPGGYPSAAYIQFTGTGVTGSIGIRGGGFTSFDSFTGCPGPGPGQVARWGDYAAATVDATTGFFYTANEMIPNPALFTRGFFANWGTFITQLH
ncbi:MAG: hypothetical protein ACREC0_14430 [Methylocella sp.]